MASDPKSEIGAALTKLCRDFGMQGIHDPARVRAALTDVLGNEVRTVRDEVDAVVAASELGIAEILAYDASGIDALVDRLTDQGISPTLARLAVEVWSDALAPFRTPTLVPEEDATLVVPAAELSATVLPDALTLENPNLVPPGNAEPMISRRRKGKRAVLVGALAFVVMASTVAYAANRTDDGGSAAARDATTTSQAATPDTGPTRDPNSTSTSTTGPTTTATTTSTTIVITPRVATSTTDTRVDRTTTTTTNGKPDPPTTTTTTEVTTATTAKPPDSDGDGVADTTDLCDNTDGSKPTGCPAPTAGGLVWTLNVTSNPAVYLAVGTFSSAPENHPIILASYTQPVSSTSGFAQPTVSAHTALCGGKLCVVFRNCNNTTQTWTFNFTVKDTISGRTATGQVTVHTKVASNQPPTIC